MFFERRHVCSALEFVAPGSAALFPVIRVVLNHRHCAVKLFREQHPHHGVRERHRRKGKQQVGMGFQFLVKPVGTANNESKIAPSLHPDRQFASQVGRGELLTAFVQRYSYTAGREDGKEAGLFHCQCPRDR